MKVHVTITETETENDYGRNVPSIVAKCTECDHEVVSFGQGDASRRRCLAVMREECPMDESNFYVEY